MTDTVDHLVLEHLRATRADVATIRDDVREVKHRLTSLEGAVAGLKRDQAASYADTADQHPAMTAWRSDWSASNIGWACGIPIADDPPPQGP